MKKSEYEQWQDLVENKPKLVMSAGSLLIGNGFSGLDILPMYSRGVFTIKDYNTYISGGQAIGIALNSAGSEGYVNIKI